ncbi:hypothetical protein LTR84_000084 [Exophiala bonariae]|uniref:Dynamin-binding protein n=1 Tax=Exophiala bonariae TaxID=1690606 RepID=A0AAV9NPL4_9EURO|nr:hypothetical protein LTR84_000084 [Exophiala bonariae]
MPSAVSNQKNYYTTHHRRQSSLSQTNLTDQIVASPTQVTSPSQSLVFLPSTAYQPQVPAPRTRTPSLSTTALSNIRLDLAREENVINDPHEFYRRYQDPFVNSAPIGSHQEGIRTTADEQEVAQYTSRKSSFASSQANDDRGQRSVRNSVSARKLSVNTQQTQLEGVNSKSSSSAPNTLRSRKTSFKDLVARFDASPDEVPPLPTQQISRPSSRTASPMSGFANVEFGHSAGTGTQPKRPSSRLSESYRRNGSASASTGIPNTKSLTGRNRTSSLASGLTKSVTHPESSQSGRKLLFGEVLPSVSQTAAAGYGIANVRRRRGSEGSPMHSPNPMFPSNSSTSTIQRPPSTSSQILQPPTSSQSHVGLSQEAQSHRSHRRAQSDFANPSIRTSGRQGGIVSAVNFETALSSPDSTGDGTSKVNGQSRIPVSTRHQRMASDSATMSTINAHPAFVSQLPLRNLASSQPRFNPAPSGDRKAASPKRRPRSPIQIKSPGRRGKEITASSEKSPSLRANIIAPPPKISPPLRSSRPRLPVSSASTAASRAKIADKFQIMAKEQSDKRGYRRQRPPELSDIDLKARRLKITQALSRSREGEDLRTGDFKTHDSSKSRTNSMTPSFSGSNNENPSFPDHIDIPAVVVNFSGPPTDMSEERAFYTPDDQSARDRTTYTQNALRIVESNSRQPAAEVDSPTLGHAESAFGSIPFSLNTQLVPTMLEQEPSSALTEDTIATEATMIDMEPQTDASRLQTPAQSLYAQISAFRSQDSNSPMSASSQASGELSDHADGVSVQLGLRETTYLDDVEAAEKGYRPFLASAGSDIATSRSNGRSSWTSSIDELPESESGENTLPVHGLSQPPNQPPADPGSTSLSDSIHSSNQDDSQEEPGELDVYTIVNIVLQQQTPSGVVDQQLVDDIYHRIIQVAPDLASTDAVDDDTIRQLCLHELENYHNQWDEPESSRPQSADYSHSDDLTDAHRNANENADGITNEQTDENSHTEPFPKSKSKEPALPPSSYRGHHYKSSLDSAEDWAETSPSVGDWIQFALKSPVENQQVRPQSTLSREVTRQDHIATSSVNAEDEQAPGPVWNSHVDDSPTLGVGRDIPRPPSHSPPPPPTTILPSIDQTAHSAPAGITPPETQTSQPTRPHTTVSMSARSSLDHHGVPSSSSMNRPSEESNISPDQRRLNKRRHILKELVDTEYTYERDMRVLCDIYKQTAVVAISEEDTKIIFGNVEAVQHFAKDFLALLKQVVWPAYIIDKADKRKDGNRVSTVQGSGASIDGLADMTEAEKDEVTRVGHAFEVSMSDMEKVYSEYVRTRHPANKRLQALSTNSAVDEWLKECSANSSDITNAWSLDALLVKPIQRITKYPLLLSQLVDATPLTHPDYEFIRKALVEVTEVNIRINDVKKHTEIVDQVLNRKRKESDVRTGLTKAFGRRAEKLRQHVGINEIYEDPEYAKIKISYDNNIAHLFLVTKDCQGYIEAMKEWVDRICGIAAAAETWVDVGHTSYPQAESKLRQFAIVVRGVHSIALPDHIEQVTKRVIQPMEKTATMLERFKVDSKGLIQKREKRLLDYNQFKNKRDRGEKMDKKMTERMEQWEALNLEAKERMKRLHSSTADLVLACQASLIELQKSWLQMCKVKFSAAMELDLNHLEPAEIMKEWQEEFDPQHVYAMTLSICNGTLLAEAINLLSFLSPGTTLTGDDSPRQPSWNSSVKRSASTNEGLIHASMSDHHHRYTEGPTSPNSDDRSDHTSFTFANGRIRAPSAASGRPPKTPEALPRNVTATSLHTTHSGNISRPGTSLEHSDDYLRSAPRVSLEAPSPTIGALFTESSAAAKHASTSTFYSAAPGPSHSQHQLPPSRGSVFSSAMPMDESNGTPNEGAPETEADREPGVLFTAASVYEFNIDRSRQQGGFRYLTYVTGEIFDVIAEHGELWLAINQDDDTREIGWIWNKHFAKLAT